MSGAGTEETPHPTAHDAPPPPPPRAPGATSQPAHPPVEALRLTAFWGGSGRRLPIPASWILGGASDSPSISSSRTECGDRPESDWVRLRKRSGPGSALETRPGLDPTRKPDRASVGPSLTWKPNLTWVRLGATGCDLESGRSQGSD